MSISESEKIHAKYTCLIALEYCFLREKPNSWGAGWQYGTILRRTKRLGRPKLPKQPECGLPLKLFEPAKSRLMQH
jgi:hypothetical protein